MADKESKHAGSSKKSTSAERMRRYRLKKKEEDPEYGQKESQRIASLIKQKRENLTGMEKREFKKNRDAVAKWRAKKKEENKTATSTGFKPPPKALGKQRSACRTYYHIRLQSGSN
ncbi:hypothetical protein RRG08_054120 [Elysia crispata]|uniref:Uncharacterized protein n=1 Tax=Elysia crispata TaxID=231223 RepID=A0AAE0Z385_9GAST|nr:hypothetical protein RRG08_054120 [Elysia crispata]